MSTAARASGADEAPDASPVDLEFLFLIGDPDERRREVQDKSLLYATLFLLRVGCLGALLLLVAAYGICSWITSSPAVDAFFRTVWSWPAIGIYAFILASLNGWLRHLGNEIRLIEVAGALTDRVVALEAELDEWPAAVDIILRRGAFQR